MDVSTKNAASIEAIAQDWRNVELRQRYSDWLARLGDPRGEFIRFAKRCAARRFGNTA
jgi:uncharacterized protein (TIGR02996 family)